MTQSNMSISTSNPCPRIPFESLASHVGKRIRLVGIVKSISGSTMSIQCDPDNEGSMVTVNLTGVAPVDQYTEVEGVVESPNAIREESNTGLGNDFGTSWRPTTGRNYIYENWTGREGLECSVRSGIRIRSRSSNRSNSGSSGSP